MQRFEDFIARIRSAEHLSAAEAAEVLAEIEASRQTHQKEAVELDWVMSVEAQLHRRIDVARASVFQALASGRCKATGYIEGIPERTDDYPDGEWAQIAPESWTYRNFNWDDSTLTTQQTAYQAVQVRTDDMFDIFPRPSCEAVDHMASVYPGVAILKDDGENESVQAITARRPRGRPQKWDGMIKTAVQNAFGERIQRGKTPDKEEALIQEIIDFVRLVFRERIARSTVQGYIGPLRATVPRNPPGIPAGK